MLYSGSDPRNFLDLELSDKKRLCDLIINRRVSLFLGSGVSLDSKGPNGPMMSARVLCEHLIKLNDLPSATSLQQAYSMMNPDQVHDEITVNFSCVELGNSIKKLADVPWRRVYTLNVDNCFEKAFSQVINIREFSQDCMEVINYVDSFSDQLSEIRCSIVHLHGMVERYKDGYVFSRNEYAKIMARPNSWMLTLSQLIRTDAFIVAGTSFDEIDVEFYLEQRSQESSRKDLPPSILIEPFPNKLTYRLCEKHNFCLFHGSVLDFFTELAIIDSRIDKPWINNADDGLSGLGLDSTDRLRFSTMFETIPDQPTAIANPARFLLGAELTWEMIAANADTLRDVHTKVRERIFDTLKSQSARLLVIIDQAGSGKTSFLKRMAYDISRGSELVFWYSNLGLEMEPKKIAEVFDKITNPVFIFVDNFADSLNSISLILEKTTKNNILFVCAERDYRLSYIENSFVGEDYVQIKDLLKLTMREARRLRDAHLKEGLSTIHTVSDKKFFAQTVGKSIAEANCRIQNNFKTIDRIVADLIKDCVQDEVNVYLTVALARHCFSLGVRRNALSSITHSDSVEFLLSSDSPLPLKYSDQQNSFVVPKFSLIGDRFLEEKKKSKSKEMYDAFVDLASSIAPRVTPLSIRMKTPEAQLLGRLMDFDNNVKRFIDSYAELYYETLRPTCGWNARYWEQMSLLKLDRYFSSPEDIYLLEESIQHARSAISAEVHPFSLTTLAKVLFQAMDKNSNRRDSLFSEAWNNISEANDRESRWNSRGATLFIVCFSGVLRYLEMGGQLNGDQYEKLRDMVSSTHKLKIKDRILIAKRQSISEILQ